MKTFSEIKTRFPYQFSEKNIGLDIANGWLPMFERLCHDIDNALGVDKHGFHWVQLKEKFGSARFYWKMSGVQKSMAIDLIGPDGNVLSFRNKPKAKLDDKQLVQKIDDLISTAESKTANMCIVCGDEGKPDNMDYYTLVVCEKHRRARHAGEELDIWPGEDQQ